MRATFLAAALLMLAGVAPGASIAAPLPMPSLPAAQPAPLASPYDPKADASAAVDRAFETARSSGREVLLDFGANWCPDCRMLAGVLAMPQVSPWIDAHFVKVLIDVGRIDRNLELASRYGVKISAIPCVLILRPDGTLLNPDGTRTLGDARTMTAGAMVALLAEWGGRTRPPR